MVKTVEYCQYKITAATEKGVRDVHFSSVVQVNSATDKKAERAVMSCFKALVGRGTAVSDVQKKKNLYTKVSVVKSYGDAPNLLIDMLVLDTSYVMTHILNRNERRIFGASKIERKL